MRFPCTTLFLALLLSAQPGWGQEPWKLRSDKGGIKTYMQFSPGTRIKTIRLESVFPVSIAKMVAVIADISGYDKWVYNSRSSRILRRVSPTELFYYSELVFPWPAANRDFVSHVRITQDPKTKQVTILGSNISGMEPEHARMVRMNYGEGKWELTPISAQEVSVIYTLNADPAGELPAWIVNGFISQGPITTFRQLHTYVQTASLADFALPYPL